MKSMRIGGGDLYYVDHGSGTPLLLVHGFALDHTMWENQIEVLSDRYRVVAPDLQGFGRSPVRGDATTMEQMADDLAALLDGLSIPRVVLGCLSMGGYVAFQFWRRHAARLQGLILCDTRPTADTPEAAAARLEMADRVLREGLRPLVDSMLPRLFSETTCRQWPELVEQIRDVMMSGNPRGIAAAARGMAQRPDMTEFLGQIHCPTLALVGRDDAFSPPEAVRGMARAIPGAQYVEIADAGHLAPLEKPEEVNQAIIHFMPA